MNRYSIDMQMLFDPIFKLQLEILVLKAKLNQLEARESNNIRSQIEVCIALHLKKLELRQLYFISTLVI